MLRKSAIRFIDHDRCTLYTKNESSPIVSEPGEGGHEKRGVSGVALLNILINISSTSIEHIRRVIDLMRSYHDLCEDSDTTIIRWKCDSQSQQYIVPLFKKNKHFTNFRGTP